MRPEYVIWSFEHDAWWAPGHHGYTLDLRKAGRYGLTEAQQIVKSANALGEVNEAMILDDHIVARV